MKNRAKILVVDDDRRMVKTICDILEFKGYQVLAAYSGEEAVQMVPAHSPGCVLMDIKMEGISGIETLKIIKEKCPALPIILMSAYATEDQMKTAKEYGAYTILDKPINVQVVLSFLSTLMKEKSVLIVDDDPNFCKTLKGILASRGYGVETEIDPEAAISHLTEDYKLVVLLDLKLGDHDGTDILEKIRQKYPTKPVILVTGYGEEMADTINKGLNIGAYALLYKPLEIDLLVKHIEEIDRLKLQSLLGEHVDF